MSLTLGKGWSILWMDIGKATSAIALFLMNGLSNFILDYCIFYLQTLESEATDSMLRK